MDDFYTKAQQKLQAQHQTRKLADRLSEIIVHTNFAPEDVAFISDCNFFFLSTVDPSGHPTVSYKGGNPGFVRIVDNTLRFPCYDGNGMFLSMGNISANPKVGLLFIDFEVPRRLRVQGSARLIETFDKDEFPGAIGLVSIQPQSIFPNCGRYIHRRVLASNSPHVPKEDGSVPLAKWKRLDLLQDVLPPSEQARAQDEGLIDLEHAIELANKGNA